MTSSYSGTSYVTCHCGETAAIRVSTTSLNPGRRFFGCKNFGHPEKRDCGFFDWVDKDVSVTSKERDMYRQMNNFKVAKEDLRAVVDGLKVLNTEMGKKLESEKKKRLELQRKFDVTMDELMYFKKCTFIVLFALILCVIYIWY